MRRWLTLVWCALLLGPAQAGVVKYMLWDSVQLPAYRQCAADFEKAHPGTKIKILQAGWGDYWTTLSTGLIAGAAPDVFTNHLSKYPEFVANGLLEDLGPYLKRDRIDLGIYPGPLLDVWSRDGHQYGLPKDWDTVALIVNVDHATRAGVGLDELRRMTWNPRDGGSFEQVLRRLTLDRNGRNANDPAFDRRHVAVYGYQTGADAGMSGQTEWSHFAVSNGFRYQDAPWSLPYRYDDVRLAQTLDWIAGLPAKGLSAPSEQVAGIGVGGMFVTGRAAMVVEGSWMISWFAHAARFRTAWVPLPIGPSGRRASMLNGLSDAMWSGSPVKEEAWQWIRHLASVECQRVVAARGVTFPAISGLAEQVVAAQRAQGIDTEAFLQMRREQTFAMPVAGHGAEVDALMKHAIQSVLLGRQTAAAALAEANTKINALSRRR